MIFVRVRVSTLQILPKANVKKPTHQHRSQRHILSERTTGSSNDSHTGHTSQSQRSVVQPIPNKPYNPPPDRYARRLSYTKLVLWIRDESGVCENVRFCA